jgi:gamma-glutamyltranspeptidase/glutathione hydrolase
MVASPTRFATEVGRDILAAGGNAIDAAVATAFAVGVTEPYHSGIGGGGFILLHLGKTGELLALDARETAPAAAHRNLYRGPDGDVDRDAPRWGGLAVAVPGLVRGLLEVHERFGSLPREAVLEPAIRLCREGFPIGVRHQRILRFVHDRLGGRFPETARIHLPGGEVPELGTRLVQPELARVHRAIARKGADAFYRGWVADSIVTSVRETGGILTMGDLSGYRTRWRPPVRGTYRGVEVVSMPPPSSGGVHLIQMLNTLEPFDLEAWGANSSDTIHHVAGAMKLAFADRAVHLGDPDFHSVPAEWLTSKAYGLELAARLRPPPVWLRPPWRWGRPSIVRVHRAGTPPPDDGGTSHISVMDAEGNAVAITQTVNLLFGSLVTARGTGIVLNNEMDDFAAAPNVPNAFGLVGHDANAVEPGKRPLSSMTPTLLLREGVPWMVVGSAGGPRIITTVLEVVLGVVDYDMNIAAAVSAPRFHHQWRPDVLALEPDHPRDVIERLRRIGHNVRVSDGPWSSAQAVLWDREQGLFSGVSDPRSDGLAAGPSLSE